jgi:spore maturation protein SpmA
LNNSSVVIGFGPSAVITVKEPLGTRSPTLIVMISILSSFWYENNATRAAAGHNLAFRAN